MKPLHKPLLPVLHSMGGLEYERDFSISPSAERGCRVLGRTVRGSLSLLCVCKNRVIGLSHEQKTNVLKYEHDNMRAETSYTHVHFCLGAFFFSTSSLSRWVKRFLCCWGSGSGRLSELTFLDVGIKGRRISSYNSTSGSKAITCRFKLRHALMEALGKRRQEK